jgi:hypothetical protein
VASGAQSSLKNVNKARGRDLHSVFPSRFSGMPAPDKLEPSAPEAALATRYLFLAHGGSSKHLLGVGVQWLLLLDFRMGWAGPCSTTTPPKGLAPAPFPLPSFLSMLQLGWLSAQPPGPGWGLLDTPLSSLGHSPMPQGFSVGVPALLQSFLGLLCLLTPLEHRSYL